jgi:uncharacterized membrane protein YecN with MAPEG domain
MVDGMVNGWIIPKGRHELTLTYETQRYYQFGLFISFISYVVGLAVLIWYLVRQYRLPSQV